MPSSEIQVTSVTCCRPPPESKSTSSPIASPSVAAANSSDTNPAPRPPSLVAPGTSAASRPPASGRKIEHGSASAAHHQEVEGERRDAGHQQQRVVAQQARLRRRARASCRRARRAPCRTPCRRSRPARRRSRRTGPSASVGRTIARSYSSSKYHLCARKPCRPRKRCAPARSVDPGIAHVQQPGEPDAGQRGERRRRPAPAPRGRPTRRCRRSASPRTSGARKFSTTCVTPGICSTPATTASTARITIATLHRRARARRCGARGPG